MTINGYPGEWTSKQTVIVKRVMLDTCVFPLTLTLAPVRLSTAPSQAFGYVLCPLQPLTCGASFRFENPKCSFPQELVLDIAALG